jgi:hypothetical protein
VSYRLLLGGKIQSVQEDMAVRRIVEQARTLQNHTILYLTAIPGGLGGGEQSLLSDDDVVVTHVISIK